MSKKRFSYYLICDRKNYDLVLYNRFIEDEIFRCCGFQTMYKFIKNNEIDFNDVIIKHLTFNNLFNFFVDISSIDETKKGDRI